MAIDLAGIVFLAAVGILLPWAAVRSARRLDSGAAFPPRQRFYVATIGQQLVMASLALWAAGSNRIRLLPPAGMETRNTLLALGFLAALLVFLPWRWRSMSAPERGRLALLLPGTARQKVLYAPLAVTAGIGEELVYRGTMYGLLQRLTGSSWVAAVFAAADFALGHAVQGRVAAAFVGIVALAFQGLAAVTGALYAGMAVHALFDLSVGLFAAQLLGFVPVERHVPHEPEGPAQV